MTSIEEASESRSNYFDGVSYRSSLLISIVPRRNTLNFANILQVNLARLTDPNRKFQDGESYDSIASGSPREKYRTLAVEVVFAIPHEEASSSSSEAGSETS